MISIIICSRTKLINDDLFNNIKETIGCVYELIVIDNSEIKFSIFEAYNFGIKKSKGEFIVFLHDDIFIHTNNWGNIIKRIFNSTKNIGLLGIAGSKVKSKMPSGWWNCPDEFKEINIIQHLSNTNIEKWEYGFKESMISEVVAIDGVFMVMKRGLDIYFNNSLKGFHNYDLNVSLECQKKGYKIFVTNEILIEHYSNGNLNNSWYESTTKIHQIYKETLPLVAKDVYDVKFLNELEFQNGKRFLNHFMKIGKKKEGFRILLGLFILKPKFFYYMKIAIKLLVSKII